MTYKAVAQALGVKFQTILKIVKRWKDNDCTFATEGWANSTHAFKFGSVDELRMTSHDLLQEQSTMTMAERVEDLANRGYRMHKATLRRIYKRRGISYKKVDLANVLKMRKADEIKQK
jgi:transposase